MLPLHATGAGMPASPKRRTPPQERHAFGLTILAFSHPEVRRLQPAAGQPVLHGPKVWPTSFVLIDYLSQRGVPARARVLDLGCGWGLVGIACAKTFQAQVTGLDADAAVFPYLQLHAQRNGVSITTRQGAFADLAPQKLAAFDLIVGAEICFWEELVAPLYQLAQLPHSKPCFGSIKAHKCLVFLEECWKAHIVTNSTSFSLDFPNEYARLDSPIEVMKPKT